MLSRQVFSQQMLENLINDLMDHAKMENGTFKFDEDYFSLSSVIYEAFSMLNFSANERGIDLKGKIDCRKNLGLI